MEHISGLQFKELIQKRFKDMPKLLKVVKFSQKDLNTDLGIYRVIMQIVPYYCGKLDSASYYTRVFRGTTLHRVKTIMDKLNSPMIFRLLDNNTPNEFDWKARLYAYKLINQIGCR